MFRHRLFRVLGFALTLAGCGDDPAGPQPLQLDALVGTWAVSQWTYTNVQSPSLTADWVQTKGLSGTLTVAASGAFTVTPMLPSGFGSDQGTLTVAGDSIYWDGNNDEEWVHARLAGASLTLTWPEVEFVDMNGDGMPEDVRLAVVLQRTP